jgi:hypothetical protein
MDILKNKCLKFIPTSYKAIGDKQQREVVHKCTTDIASTHQQAANKDHWLHPKPVDENPSKHS